MENHPKNLNAKAILGTFASSFALFGYLLYYVYFEIIGVKLNELYFIITCVPIAIFTGILFTFFSNKNLKTLLLYTSVYYSLLVVMYVGSWVILGQPYGYIKQALIAGLVVGIIYRLYDYFTNANG